MTETTTAHRIFHWLNAILLALLIGGIATPAVAVLSGKTGRIQGQAPTVTGVLQVADTEAMSKMSPNQFKVSSSTDRLELQDADSDSGLSALIDTDHATINWYHDGIALTPEQLATPIGDNFSGQTLTLEVSAPVTASSVTGLPTTAEPKILTHSLVLLVPGRFIGLTANGQTFDMDAGFPSTGFSQATFTVDMKGNPDDYIWSSNQPSNVVTVNNSGQVMFDAPPSSGAVTITATPKSGGDPLTYSFNIKSWFSAPGINVRNDSVVLYCQSRGLVLPTRAQFSSGTDTRQVGSLFGEWGNMLNYSAGFTDVYYWSSDIGPNESRYFGSLVNGGFSTARTSELAAQLNASCVKDL